MDFTQYELDLLRQWYDSLSDVHPKFIEQKDADLYIKIMRGLGLSVSPRLLESNNHQINSQAK